MRNCAGLATLGVGRRGGRPRFGVSCFGHLGDGNIHFSVSQPTSADKSAFLARRDAINDVVHAIAAWMGGSFSAEHGGEQLKLAADERPGRRARGHAGGQSGARLERGEESGQAALTCRKTGRRHGRTPIVNGW